MLNEYNISWPIGDLYFKYISGSELERKGWTSEKLAKFLNEKGFIKLLKCLECEQTFQKPHTRYVPIRGKPLSRQVIEKALLKEKENVCATKQR